MPKFGEGPIINLKPEVELTNSSSGPSYYTQVQKSEGKMNGYRLNTVTMRSENTWRINVGAEDEEILDVTT